MYTCAVPTDKCLLDLGLDWTMNNGKVFYIKLKYTDQAAMPVFPSKGRSYTAIYAPGLSVAEKLEIVYYGSFSSLSIEAVVYSCENL